jgi:hypothetical protein
MKTCKIRKDILHYGIPYGKEGKFIPEELKNSNFEYRWDELDTFFEIKINGVWEEADSIDFEFNNSE